MIKERPILFTAEMVNAILAGNKTMTRRVIKPQPHPDFLSRGIAGMAAQWPKQDGIRIFMKDGCSELVKCPYGRPGDRLWVREAWRAAKCYDELNGTQLTGKISGRNIKYIEGVDKFLSGPQIGRYRHARFMPRWASRITLEITNIKVERAQDITDTDALREGVDRTNTSITSIPGYAVQRFKALWDSIYKDWGYGWDSNPWVWVIKFKKI